LRGGGQPKNGDRGHDLVHEKGEPKERKPAVRGTKASASNYSIHWGTWAPFTMKKKKKKKGRQYGGVPLLEERDDVKQTGTSPTARGGVQLQDRSAYLCRKKREECEKELLLKGTRKSLKRVAHRSPQGGTVHCQKDRPLKL